jgi:fatty-acyl-CoA synthase
MSVNEASRVQVGQETLRRRPADFYRRLIEPTRVHGSLYTDPDVYADELARIWYAGWVYAGHSSEVRAPGDRVRTSIGPVPVDLVRTGDGQVELYEAGGAAVPRVAEHHGFVFGSFADDGPHLLDHLGAAATEIDRLARLSPEGEVELTTGWVRHRTRANWKLLAENETDGYHPQFVHASVFAATDSPIGALYTDSSRVANRDLGNGHSELDLRPEFRRLDEPMLWFGTRESKVPDYVARMRAVRGESARELLVDGAPHVMVFPNLFIAEVTVFVIQPLAVDLSVQHATAIQLKGAPDMNARLLSQCVASVGPAGMLLADDTEMYERNQDGLAVRNPEWLDLSRGLHRETVDERGLRTGRATDESAMRGFWRHYRELMTAP